MLPTHFRPARFSTERSARKEFPPRFFSGFPTSVAVALVGVTVRVGRARSRRPPISGTISWIPAKIGVLRCAQNDSKKMIHSPGTRLCRSVAPSKIIHHGDTEF